MLCAHFSHIIVQHITVQLPLAFYFGEGGVHVTGKKLWLFSCREGAEKQGWVGQRRISFGSGGVDCFWMWGCGGGILRGGCFLLLNYFLILYRFCNLN